MPEKGCDNEKGKKKSVKIGHKSGEIQQNCDPGGNMERVMKNRRLLEKIGRVGEYFLKGKLFNSS